MPETPKKINKEQESAIKFKDGPLLIIAGAGTGKTTVITERIKYLVLSGKAKIDEILALTFTEKAAREMEERVDVGLPYGYSEMWIMTFHSFCDRVLRRDALQIGLDTRYKLMTGAESIQLLRDNLFKLKLNYFRPLGNPNKFVEGILSHFSRLTDEDISPKEYFDWAKTQKAVSEEEKLEKDKWTELATVYKTYDQLKIKEGVMDFGDLIAKTLKLFRERQNILATYKKQFKYILVDEFQDTNFSQNELVKLLAGKNGNITVVADDDQSIYRFRGAAVSNVIQFRNSFPKTKVVVLNKNYRSSQEILDRSYDLIQFNNPDRLEVVEKIDKKLTSQIDRGHEEVEFIHTDRVENEAEVVTKKIEKMIQEGGRKYNDVAILVRANAHAEPFIRSMARHGIPSQFLGPGRLFKQPEIIDLISYLKVLNNFEDSPAFYRILAIDYFDIDGRELAALGNYSKKHNLSLYETAENIKKVNVKKSTVKKINKLLKIIKKHLDLVKKETAGQLLYFFLEDTGLLQKLLSPDSPDAEKKAANISKFFDKLKSYEGSHDDASVYSVVGWLDLSIELGESPIAQESDWTQINAVNILTVHSSKGLEFPIVFLVNLVAQRFPSTDRREQIPIPESLIKEVLPVGNYHIEEERRLFYVGMTRAREKLYLSASDYYGDAKRQKKLSPFIFEALGENALASEESFVKNEQLSFLDYKPPLSDKKLSKLEVPPLHIDYLSYSQIDTFQTCPMHYKLKYIYKLPTPQSASQSFGTSIHAAIKDFYLEVGGGKRATEKLLYKLFERNWNPLGFTSKKHEKEFFEKGKIYLAGFLKQGFNQKVNTLALETPFTAPLKVGAGERQLKIGGQIDRIDDLGNGQIEIIDYKTGATIPSQKEVDKNLQLSFYALAAVKIKDKPFGWTPEQVKLSLYFLDNQEKISTTRSLKDLENAEKEILKVRQEIEKSDFKCSGHMFCQTGCEYSLFCRSED